MLILHLTTDIISTLKFPFVFDADAMKNDLRKFSSEDWISRFNTAYYEGDWSDIALRASRNAALQLYPDPTAEGYENTETLARCAYFRRVIDAFKYEVESVRLLRARARKFSSIGSISPVLKTAQRGFIFR